MARSTRKHLLDAVDWRWFDKRYEDTASQDTDYVFDTQMAVHPDTTARCHCQDDHHREGRRLGCGAGGGSGSRRCGSIDDACGYRCRKARCVAGSQSG